MVWSTTLVLWAEVATYLHAVDTAPALLSLLVRYDDQVVFNGVSTFGPIADYLGMLETALGHYDQANTYLDQAMAIHERFQAPFFLARTKLHRAELYAKRAAPGDEARARELLEQTLILAGQHGYAGVKRQAESLQP